MHTKPTLPSRRDFLKASAAGAATLAAGYWGFNKFHNATPAIPGGMVGANSKTGHLLRTGVTQKPSQTVEISTLVIGGGIAGLSAGWWLQKNGHHDFLVIEMDGEAGGNSVNGENKVSKYPWGAHYVPLPGPDAKYVREFFEEVGIIQGYDKGLPIYNEYYLCADPNERLYFQGEWQEGLVPQYGITLQEKTQYKSFFSYMEKLKDKKGSDGKHLFNIPMELSSRDPEYLKLDKISMAEFMRTQGWDSPHLNWYVNYACRDDFGMPHDKVSAWAGIHYFASRNGHAANAEGSAVVTWPEGNGFLVNKLKQKLGAKIQTHSLAFNIETNNNNAVADVLNTETQSCVRYIAKNIIYCGPRFTASKVIKNYHFKAKLEYAPWLIANITLNQKPRSASGAKLSWDNVSYYSNSLGYIVANHQDLTFNHPETVITYYLPLDEFSVKEERHAAYRKSHQDWAAMVIKDLEKMHPDITPTITNIDTWVWGHGMISPGIDFLWNQRAELLKSFGNIHFAHSDMSGISIFEEAQYRGVEAAKKVLTSS